MNIFKKSLAAAAALAMPLFLAAPSASAATTTVAIYGIWGAPTFDADTKSFSGEISFPGAHVTHATYKVTYQENIDGDNYAEVLTTNDEGDWITDQTDMGKVFGSNGASDTENMLKTHVIRGITDPSYFVEITFDDEVAAGDLGLALVDLDVDSAILGATDGSSTALTAAAIQGSATTSGFNICAPVATTPPTNCAGTETSGAVVVQNVNALQFNEAADNEDQGAAAWAQPTGAVKKITAEVTGSDGGSSLRWFLAIFGDLPDNSNPGPDSGSTSDSTKRTLANTGSASDLLPGLAALLIGGLAVAVGSRRARRN